MDKREALELAKRYAVEIKKKYAFSKIILFGSYANGNFRDESDIDIAVILEDYNNLSETQLELMRLRRKIDSRIEPHPIREKDFNKLNPLANEVLKNGLLIN